MSDIREFPNDQYRILNHLKKSSDAVTIADMVGELKIDQIFISASIQTLGEMGFLDVDEELFDEIKIGKEGEPFIKSELPEKTIIKALDKNEGLLHISKLGEASGLEQKAAGKTLKVLDTKKWVEKNGPELKLTELGKKAIDVQGDDEKLFDLLRKKEKVIIDDTLKKHDFFQNGFDMLKKRSQIINIKQRSKKLVKLIAKGKSLLSKGIKELKEATQLTSELLKEGRWRDVAFKAYDINAEPARLYPGKIHPFQRIINETRRIYVEMGFTEIDSPHVESAFWDFDALFQPQDHPARDMQDTFYMKTPASVDLSKEKLVSKIRETHENGGDTGSTGWGYKWNLDMAKKVVLRTHTTAASVRQLRKTPQGPLKVFCIGKVFRRETVDYKHLPVFTQVDGIIVDKNASLAHLIGIITEFYRKMGFDKIDVRPAFFPYTEPSLEVFVYLEEKKDWVEMGGAGIFRKEVTVPMGCDLPVLAWGLGLERLAMFKFNLTDIRDIYIANINWLREVMSCL